MGCIRFPMHCHLPLHCSRQHFLFFQGKIIRFWLQVGWRLVNLCLFSLHWLLPVPLLWPPALVWNMASGQIFQRFVVHISMCVTPFNFPGFEHDPRPTSRPAWGTYSSSCSPPCSCGCPRPTNTLRTSFILCKSTFCFLKLAEHDNDILMTYK